LSKKCWSHSTFHRKFLRAPHVDVNTSYIILPNIIKKSTDRNNLTLWSVKLY
jgi:hypothetical protein